MIDFKKEVKVVHADAWCFDINHSKRFFGSNYHLYKILTNRGYLSDYEYSEERAWEKAYKTLLSQGKIKGE